MKDKKQEFFAYLDERTAAVLGEADALIKDERKDEGNALKAKANIYGIFKALWGASEKLAGEEDFVTDLYKRIDNTTSPWAVSLEAAKQHGNAMKIMIEEYKLEAVLEIKDKLDEWK